MNSDRLDHAAARFVGGLFFGPDGLHRRDVVRLVVEQFQPVLDRIAFREDLVLFELDADRLFQILDIDSLDVGALLDAALDGEVLGTLHD
ncbi:MAG: hypothetical protein JWN14_2436 [Chthonomonadales bacterium]|nr:hypothetical protein [Chthonomonadales bacterium]